MTTVPNSNTAERILHERARMLAAEAVDVELEPRDADWLAGHLSACPDCSAVAAEYNSIHAELHSLAMPEPPRDLWARTAAGLDRIDSAAPGRTPHLAGKARGAAVRAGSGPLIGTSVAVALVLVVTAASVMSQSPVATARPSTAAPAVAVLASVPVGQSPTAQVAPITVVGGTSYWLSSGNGVYQIKGGSTECANGGAGCTAGGDAGQTLGSISSDSSVSAVIAPDAKQAAVWTDNKVAIMPLNAQSQTVAIDLLTPKPTVPATVPPTPTPAVTPTSTPPSPPSSEPALASPFGTLAAPTDGPTATPATTPTPQPTTAPVPTPSPTHTATVAPATGSVAILADYQVVGRDPEFSADGTMVAFAARPVDHSTGPDVFVWRSGQQQAERVTSSHAGLFAGWFGSRLLISEIATRTSAAVPSPAASAAGTLGATSYVFDPATDSLRRIGGSMLLPSVDPSGRYLVYWTGSVQFDQSSGLWQPGSGDLYFEAWSDLTLEPVLGPEASPTAAPTVVPTATPTVEPTMSAVASPSAGESASAVPSAAGEPVAPAVDPSESAAPSVAPSNLPRLLPVAASPGAVSDWVVRWDKSGQFVAVWVANQGSATIGRLTLFSIDGRAGFINVNEPRLAADNVLASVSFDGSSLVYTSAVDGKTYVQALPAIPPSTVSTPSPTIPGQLPSGAAPTALPSDRPGN